MKKFIVWGAGRWGREALDFLGRDVVEAFIDSYKEGVYCGKPIISFDLYCLHYRNCPIFVAVSNSAAIVDILKSYEVRDYFLFSDVPGEIRHCDFRSFLLQILPNSKDPIFYLAKVFAILLRNWLETVCNNSVQIITEANMKSICLTRKKEIVVLGDEDFKYVVSLFPDKKIVNLSREFSKYISSKNAYGNLASFYLKHEGETAVIIGNGPSLTIEDLEKLNGKVTFATNRIYKIFEKTDWRPTYYVASDCVGLSQWGYELERLDLAYFIISDSNTDFWSRMMDSRFVRYHIIEQDNNKIPKFSFDITQGIYGMSTIVYECIQIAVYMGIKRIILLGVDFSYQGSPKNPANHFIQNYYEKIEGDVPVFDKQGALLALQSAKYYADLCGIEIYNSSRGGRLDIFPRTDLDSLL